MLEIQGSLGFKVDENGNVYGPSGEIRNTFRNNDGYITTNIKWISGRWETMGVHRLVAMAFIPCDNPEEMAVNHRDCDVTNNHVSNLEWVTAELNNQHAALMKGSDRPILLARKGSITEGFDSLPAAAVVLGAAPLEIWDGIKDDTPVNGWIVSFLGGKDTLPDELKKRRFERYPSDGNVVAVKVQDILTSEVQFFKSLHLAGKYHGVSSSHIHQLISTPDTPRIFKGRYLIAREDHEFPTVTEQQLEEARSRTGKDVIAHNHTTGQYSVYSSAASFVKIEGLSKKAITSRLAKGGVARVDNWSFVYLTKANVEKLKSSLEQ